MGRMRDMGGRCADVSPILCELVRLGLWALYLRCMGFNCFRGVFTRALCFPSVVARFWRVVRCLASFRRVAFALGMLSGAIFSPLLAFRVSAGVLVWSRGFRALVGRI